MAFFDAALTQELVDVTADAMVRYRGREFAMHFETPTPEISEIFETTFRGVAKILIGERTHWPEAGPERGTLVEVKDLLTNGGRWQEWKIADWRNTDDGRVIFIALSRAARV